MILNIKKGDTVKYRQWDGRKNALITDQVFLVYDDRALMISGNWVYILELTAKKISIKPGK